MIVIGPRFHFVCEALLFDVEQYDVKVRGLCSGWVRMECLGVVCG